MKCALWLSEIVPNWPEKHLAGCVFLRMLDYPPVASKSLFSKDNETFCLLHLCSYLSSLMFRGQPLALFPSFWETPCCHLPPNTVYHLFTSTVSNIYTLYMNTLSSSKFTLLEPCLITLASHPQWLPHKMSNDQKYQSLGLLFCLGETWK